MFQDQKIEVSFLLPLQEKGSSNDSFASLDFDNAERANTFFEVLKKRLLSVSRWSKYAGGDSFTFELTNADGNLKVGSPAVQDRIRIQLPGPLCKEGLGYDWIKVNHIKGGTKGSVRFFLLEVSPCACPYQTGDDTAHFYCENATNSFVIAIEDKAVQVSIHGRNEIANTANQSIADKIRNFLVAHTGILGGSKIQWENFTNNLINDNDGKV